MAAARHPGPTAGLVAAGLAAAALTARTARGCRSGRRWAGWAALLIGAASSPQAAASGFHGPYAIPDTATAVLGILLAVTILATAGRTEQQGGGTASPAPSTGGLAPILQQARSAGRVTRSPPRPAGPIRCSVRSRTSTRPSTCPLQGPSELGISADASLAHWERTAELASIEVPTLVIGAQHDTMDPAHMKMMAARLPRGRYLHCPDGSHMAMYDDQHMYFAGLIDFLLGC